MYSDIYINYWGEIYQKLGFNEYDVSFGVFITEPKKYLKEIGQESAPECIDNGFEPLLPAQAAVALRLREQERDWVYECSGLDYTTEVEETCLEQSSTKQLAPLQMLET